MRVTSPAPRDVWLELLESDPNAFVDQAPQSLDIIATIKNCTDASRLYEFPDGVKLVLPLLRREKLLARLNVERTPVFGGLIASEPVSAEKLRSVFTDLSNRPLLQTIVSASALDQEAWRDAVPDGVAVMPRLAHVLDLAGGFETVWNERFNKQGRRAVRKAERSNIDVDLDTTGRLIEPFYDLFLRSVARWAGESVEPAMIARWRAQRRDPIRRFRLMSEKLGDAFRIWGARVDGKLAAAIIVLQGPNAHYTRGAMDIDLAGPTRASFLLQKVAIENACEAGCRYYHMGQTGTSESLARFKSQFGATPRHYSEYYIERFPLAATQARLRSLMKRIVTS
ncbi:MAG: GNAT family N-acetyltransferase [Gammaproteobacteria bacterium]|nr:GNAT family N-acetyltransferase [Gammaproteobacteria bacterium]